MDAPMEDVIIAFKSDIVDQEKNLKDIKCILGFTDENKLLSLQKSGGLQEIISFIHGCLNTAKQRGEGFIFLEKLVQQCVTDVFTRNAVTWIRFIILTIESHDPSAVKSLACRVGCQILPLTVNFTALAKDVTGLLSQLLAGLMVASDEWKKDALNLMCSCIKSYPGPCGTLKGKMESMVTELLEEEMPFMEVIRLYVALASCGGGGNKGIKHTEAWTYKCQQILHSLNNTVSLLYQGLNLSESIPKYSVPALSTVNLSDNYTSRYNTLTSYFHNYCRCLQELISQPFPAPVKLPVSEIIDLVTRVLAVDVKDLLQRPSTERLLLSGYIPAVHKNAVMFLGVLIARCKTLLLPHAKMITSLLVKELLWSRVKVTYGQTRAYSQLRRTVYKTITQWLQTTQSFVTSTEEDVWLTQEIIHDSSLHTDNVKISPKTDKKSLHFEPPPAKKKKKGGYSELSHGISSQKKTDTTADSDLCCSALEALNCLIGVVGCQLKKKIIEDVQEFIVTTALTFRTRGNYGIPYTDEKCRLCLLKVMQSLNVMPHPTAASILQYSLVILRSTALDTSHMVSTYSMKCLQICEALVHARAPCFQSPKIVIQSKTVTEHDNLETSSTYSKYRLSGQDQGDQIGQSLSNTDNSSLMQSPSESKVHHKSFGQSIIKENIAEETTFKRSNDVPSDRHINKKESVKQDNNVTRKRSIEKNEEQTEETDLKITTSEKSLRQADITKSKEEPAETQVIPVAGSQERNNSQSVSKSAGHADEIDVAMESDDQMESEGGEEEIEEKETEAKPNVLSNEDQEDLDGMLCSFVDVDTDH